MPARIRVSTSPFSCGPVTSKPAVSRLSCPIFSSSVIRLINLATTAFMGTGLVDARANRQPAAMVPINPRNNLPVVDVEVFMLGGSVRPSGSAYKFQAFPEKWQCSDLRRSAGFSPLHPTKRFGR